MKDEIKEIEKMIDITEILDYLKKHFELRPSETKLLLDYITNLQEENETLETIKDYHINIIDSMEDYKSRVDKAIEYIKEIGKLNDAGNYQQFKDYKEYNELLNILQGEDKDE